MKSDEKLLREAVREILEEEWADYGGVTPWTAPGMGGGVKGSKSSMSFGVPGNSLYSIFIDPFVNAAKVIGAEVGQTGVRLVGLLRTALEAALSVLLPKFQADYGKIEKQQKAQIDKIREHYKSSYEAVEDAWEHPDIQLFAFLHDPSTWLSYKMITAKPQAVLSVYDTIAEGNQSLILYLRDIRNRMYGTTTPGGPLPGAFEPRHEAAIPAPKKKTKEEKMEQKRPNRMYNFFDALSLSGGIAFLLFTGVIIGAYMEAHQLDGGADIRKNFMTALFTFISSKFITQYELGKNTPEKEEDKK